MAKQNKPRTRAGTWKVFERRYGAVAKPDDSILRDDDELPPGIDARFVWTVLDCDGRLYVAPGYHWVNRIGYVVSAKPWPAWEEESPGYLY